MCPAVSFDPPSYGQAWPFGDRNFSRLFALLRCQPLVPLPASTGLRQPIHARQLAADASPPVCIALGGDTTLSATPP